MFIFHCELLTLNANNTSNGSLPPLLLQFLYYAWIWPAVISFWWLWYIQHVYICSTSVSSWNFLLFAPLHFYLWLRDFQYDHWGDRLQNIQLRYWMISSDGSCNNTIAVTIAHNSWPGHFQLAFHPMMSQFTSNSQFSMMHNILIYFGCY